VTSFPLELLPVIITPDASLPEMMLLPMKTDEELLIWISKDETVIFG
jgi:hypothetical protein